MTKLEIENIHRQATLFLDNAEVSEAFETVGKLSHELSRADINDELERLHMSYMFMLKYLEQGIGFSELINIMRIDYAEQYILNNRSAKQAEIAEACGFISASAFNSVFKKVTGITPKAWVSRWKSENETM